MAKFVEALVRVTTVERAFLGYDDDGVLVEYDTRDLRTREKLEILEVIEEENV